MRCPSPKAANITGELRTTSSCIRRARAARHPHSPAPPVRPAVRPMGLSARALPLPPLCRRNFGWLGSCSRFGIGNVRARVRSRLAHTRSTVHRQPTRSHPGRPGVDRENEHQVRILFPQGRRAGNLCVALPSVALPCVRDTGAPRSPTPTLGLNCIALHLHFPHHFVRASMCGSGSGIAVLRRGGKQTIIGRGDGDRLATN